MPALKSKFQMLRQGFGHVINLFNSQLPQITGTDRIFNDAVNLKVVVS